MSQQFPQQPHQPNQQQPGWGGPQTPPGYAAPPFQPLPPKKPGAGKIIGLGCAGVIGLFVVIGIIGAATSGGDSTDNSNKDKAVAATGKSTTDDAKDEPAKEEPAKEENPVESTKTQAEEFQACVAKSGTPTEQAAIKHVTKVTGADKRNTWMLPRCSPTSAAD